MSERRAADSDRIIVAELTGAAQHHARWEPPCDETTATAAAELREIADGRRDLLAEVAGIFLGTSEGELHEPRARNAAEFCRAAGADPDLIPRWVEEGRRRTAQARKRLCEALTLAENVAGLDARFGSASIASAP